MITINSTSNQKVIYWNKLHEKKYRDKYRQFLIEDEHLLNEALKHNCLKTIIYTDKYPNITNFAGESVLVSESVMNKLSTHSSKAKVIGVCDYIEYQLDKMKKIVILDGLQDPGNVGTIIRTAHSFDFDTVVLGNNCVDLYNDKVIKASQGALFHINIIRKELKQFIEELKKRNILIVGTALENAIPLSDFKKEDSLALVFGNEGQGISKEILEKCDKKLFIEINEFDSLNVAIAAGICLYYFK